MLISLLRAGNNDAIKAHPPFDLSLNAAILTMAAKHIPMGWTVDDGVTAEAPDTYAKLRTHVELCLKHGQPLVVSRDGLDNSIYGDREVNAAARAWHDWVHYLRGYTFAPHGEFATYLVQVQQLEDEYGLGPQVDRWRQLLHADIVGQSCYYAIHKRFVVDQRAFVQAVLKYGDSVIRQEW